MKNVVSMLSDDKGNVSSMRVLMILVTIGVIGSKFYNAYISKLPIVWSMEDLGLIGTVIAGKTIQNTQEKDTILK